MAWQFYRIVFGLLVIMANALAAPPPSPPNETRVRRAWQDQESNVMLLEIQEWDPRVLLTTRIVNGNLVAVAGHGAWMESGVTAGLYWGKSGDKVFRKLDARVGVRMTATNLERLDYYFERSDGPVLPNLVHGKMLLVGPWHDDSVDKIRVDGDSKFEIICDQVTACFYRLLPIDMAIKNIQLVADPGDRPSTKKIEHVLQDEQGTLFVVDRAHGGPTGGTFRVAQFGAALGEHRETEVEYIAWGDEIEIPNSHRLHDDGFADTTHYGLADGRILVLTDHLSTYAYLEDPNLMRIVPLTKILSIDYADGENIQPGLAALKRHGVDVDARYPVRANAQNCEFLLQTFGRR